MELTVAPGMSQIRRISRVALLLQTSDAVHWALSKDGSYRSKTRNREVKDEEGATNKN